MKKEECRMKKGADQFKIKNEKEKERERRGELSQGSTESRPTGCGR